MKLERLRKTRPCEEMDGQINIEKFLEIFKEFLRVKELEGASNRTISDYDTHINRYFNDFLVKERIKKNEIIDIALIRNYMGYMRDKGLKNSTINIRIRTIRSFLRWLVKEGVINNSITTKIKLVKQEEKKIQTLTDLQIKKLLKVIDTSTYTGFRDYILISLFLETGIRCNEAINLKTEHIDLNRRLIIVDSSTAKTRKERHLPISKSLQKELKELVEIAEETRTKFLFQRQTTGGLSTSHIRKILADYGKLAKIKSSVSPHILRHTFGSNWIKRGGDVFTLSNILGHSSIQMSRRYVNLDSAETRNVYDKFYS